MDLIHFIYKQFPHLKHELYAAHMPINPQDFVRKALKGALLYGLSVGVLLFFIFAQLRIPLIFAFLVIPIVFTLFLFMQFNIPKVALKRRAKEIDNEVLFAARFLLIKLNAGKPLFNALIDTSQSYGVASKYFKEIVDDINFGTPIEEALTKAMNLSPSKYFKKILFQITNALKVGIDVTDNLKIVIEEIENEQKIEIERYAKKLNSIALFYMLGAIVIPSLGMTLFTVIASLLSINLGLPLYILVLIGIILLQFFFIMLFQQIRPSVNI